jgi:hypothetical protein
MESNNESSQKTEQQQRKGLKEFFTLGEVGRYFFRRKDPTRPININIRMMHGINKISIIVFLLGLLYIILKKFL